MAPYDWHASPHISLPYRARAMTTTVRLAIQVRTVRNVPADAASMGFGAAAASPTGKAKKDAPGKAAPAPEPTREDRPRVVVEVDHIDGRAAPFRSAPTPINGTATLDVNATFAMTAPRTPALLDRLLTSPIAIRIVGIPAGGNVDDSATPRLTLSTVALDVSPLLLQDQDDVEAWLGAPDRPEPFVQAAFDAPCFTESEDETNVRLALTIGEPTAIPAVWERPVSSASPADDAKQAQDRSQPAAAVVPANVARRLTATVALHSIAFSSSTFPITHRFLLIASDLATAPAMTVTFAMDHQVEEGGDWQRHPLNVTVPVPVADTHGAIREGDLVVPIEIDLVRGAPQFVVMPTCVGDVVPRRTGAARAAVRRTPRQRLCAHLDSAIDELAREFASPGDGDLVARINDNGAYFRIKESLKAPVVAVVRDLFPPGTVLPGSHTNLSTLHDALADAVNDVLRRRFARDRHRPAEERDGNEGRDRYRRALEADVQGDDAGRVREHRARAGLRPIDDDEGRQARMQYGRALFAFGAVDEGVDVVAELVAHDHDDGVARRVLALALIERDPGDQDGARLQRIDVDRNDTDALAVGLRCIGLHRAGNARLAKRNLQRAAAALQAPASALLSQAVEFALEAGLPQGALTGVRMAEAASDDWKMREARAWALLREWDRCVDLCRQVPGRQDALRLQGEALMRLGMRDEASRTWETLLVYRGQIDRRACAWLGRHYMDKGDPGRAAQVFILALRQGESPALATLWKWLGEALEASGDDSAAIEALTEANLIDRYDPEVWELLAIACLKAGRSGEAEQAVRVLRDLGKTGRVDLRERIASGLKAAGLGARLPVAAGEP